VCGRGETQVLGGKGTGYGDKAKMVSECRLPFGAAKGMGPRFLQNNAPGSPQRIESRPGWRGERRKKKLNRLLKKQLSGKRTQRGRKKKGVLSWLRGGDDVGKKGSSGEAKKIGAGQFNLGEGYLTILPPTSEDSLSEYEGGKDR